MHRKVSPSNENCAGAKLESAQLGHGFLLCTSRISFIMGPQNFQQSWNIVLYLRCCLTGRYRSIRANKPEFFVAMVTLGIPYIDAVIPAAFAIEPGSQAVGKPEPYSHHRSPVEDPQRNSELDINSQPRKHSMNDKKQNGAEHIGSCGYAKAFQLVRAGKRIFAFDHVRTAAVGASNNGVGFFLIQFYHPLTQSQIHPETCA